MSVKEQGHKSTVELSGKPYCAVITLVTKMLLGGNEKGDLLVYLMLNSVSLEKPHQK